MAVERKGLHRPACPAKRGFARVAEDAKILFVVGRLLEVVEQLKFQRYCFDRAVSAGAPLVQILCSATTSLIEPCDDSNLFIKLRNLFRRKGPHRRLTEPFFIYTSQLKSLNL